MIDTKKILDNNDIDFWLMYGTLLGFARSKQFIPWDWDIDISAWYYDYDKIKNLKSEFEKAGYQATFQNGKYSPVTIYCSKEDRDEHNFHLDIFFWVKDKNNAVAFLHFNRNFFDRIFNGLGRMLNQDYYMGRHTSLSENTRNNISKIVDALPNKLFNFLSESIHGLHLLTCKKTVMPYDGFKKTKKINAYNSNFDIPSNYEIYLELTYGSGWRVPDKNYSKEKWNRNNKSIMKYHIKDYKVKKSWMIRWNR